MALRDHGEAVPPTKEYTAWKNLKGRCNNKNKREYHRYGGRGITVSDLWECDYNKFLADVGRAPSELHSLDRIDNDKNYEPGNCRWVTFDAQQRNTMRSNNLTFQGVTKALIDWATYFKVRHGLIRYHLGKGRTFDWVANYFIKRNGISV